MSRLADTEVPDGVALSDSLPNPLTTHVGAALLGWDATNSVWRRIQTSTSGILQGGGPKTFTDRSGTIVTGGTAQNAAAANASRTYLMVLNPTSATESLWYSVTGTAAVNGEATGSIELKAGGGFVWEGTAIPSGALSVVAATTSHKFTAAEA